MKSEQNQIPESTSKDDLTPGNGGLDKEEAGAVETESKIDEDTSAEPSFSDQQVIEKIAKQNEALLDNTESILKNIDDRDEQGQLIKGLFAKIKNYEEDFVFNNILRRLFLDLIRLYDRVDIMCGDDVKGEDTDDPSIKRMRSIRKELLQVLDRHGVEICDVSDEVFDEEIGEAIGVKAVDEPDADMKIVEVLKPAFMYSNRLLRPARVIVGKFENSDKGSENG